MLIIDWQSHESYRWLSFGHKHMSLSFEKDNSVIFLKRTASFLINSTPLILLTKCSQNYYRSSSPQQPHSRLVGIAVIRVIHHNECTGKKQQQTNARTSCEFTIGKNTSLFPTPCTFPFAISLPYTVDVNQIICSYFMISLFVASSSQAANYLVYGTLWLIASFKCHRGIPTCC